MRCKSRMASVQTRLSKPRTISTISPNQEQLACANVSLENVRSHRTRPRLKLSHDGITSSINYNMHHNHVSEGTRARYMPMRTRERTLLSTRRGVKRISNVEEIRFDVMYGGMVVFEMSRNSFGCNVRPNAHFRPITLFNVMYIYIISISISIYLYMYIYITIYDMTIVYNIVEIA